MKTLKLLDSGQLCLDLAGERVGMKKGADLSTRRDG